MKVLKIAIRRKKDLELFYYNNYEDFRSPLILEIIHLIRIVLCKLSSGRMVENEKGEEKQGEEVKEKEKSIEKEKVKGIREDNGKLEGKSKEKVILPIKSSAALKVNNKKIDGQKNKSVQTKKSSLQNNLTQQIRKVSAQVSIKMGIGSTKQLQPKKTESKPMSKSEYMTYLLNKKGSK